MSGPRGRSFGANILITFGFTGMLTVLALTNSVVIARLGGPEGRGLYSVAVAVLGILIPIATCGLGFSSTWAIGRGRGLGPVLSLDLLHGGLISGLSLTGAAAMWLWFGGMPEQEWAQVALAVLLTLPAASYAEVGRGVFLGLNQVVRYNLIQTASVGVLLIGNLVLLQRGREWVLVTLWLGYAVPGLLLLGNHLLLLGGSFALRSREFVREQLRYGVEASGSHLIEVLLLRLDYLLVGPIVGVAALGLYSVADQISTVLAWAGTVAGRLMLAESSSDTEGSLARRKLGLGVRLLGTVVVAASLGIAATGWFILPIVFGEEFRSAYLGMVVMLPTALLRGSSALVGTYLMGRDAVRPVLFAGIVATVIILVGSPLAAWLEGWEAVGFVRVVAVGTQLWLIARAYRAHSGESVGWVPGREDLVAVTAWVKVRLDRRAGRPPAPPSDGADS